MQVELNEDLEDLIELLIDIRNSSYEIRDHLNSIRKDMQDLPALIKDIVINRPQ